jgi:hypothetical protein
VISHLGGLTVDLDALQSTVLCCDFIGGRQTFPRFHGPVKLTVKVSGDG